MDGPVGFLDDLVLRQIQTGQLEGGGNPQKAKAIQDLGDNPATSLSDAVCGATVHLGLLNRTR